MQTIFEWERVLFNELPATFLFEVIFRSVVMFALLLTTLKVAGKRGVRQLSVFEVVIIISLGSAAGDPMFYEDVGMVPAITVFGTIILMYRLVTWLSAKFKWFETLVEGKTRCLIHEGQFSISKFEKEALAQDEFFSELRLKGVEHLGQVRFAYIETSGEISVFFFDDKEVKPGLPILPNLYSDKSKLIPAKGKYACTFCGKVEEHNAGTSQCSVCKHKEFVAPISTLRVR
jgi:uncharacterized membrane protein YcaP (DUF421 family)